MFLIFLCNDQVRVLWTKNPRDGHFGIELHV